MAPANVKLAVLVMNTYTIHTPKKKTKIFYEHESGGDGGSSIRIFSLSTRHHIKLIGEM